MKSVFVRFASALCLIPMAVAPIVASAQQATGGVETETERSLQQLSRDSYSKRQQATMEMWRRREQTRDQVQRAARDPDPEVAGRAKWILRQWRRGALPDTPPEISRLLQRSDGPDAIESLLEGGQITAAIVAIEESAGSVEREAIQQRIVAALERRFPIYVHHALNSESLPQLLELIDMVADSSELAMCRLQLLQQMGMDVADDALLPRSASEWTETERERASALLLVSMGRIDDAIAIARDSADPDLLHQCEMIGSRWQSAAQRNAELAAEAEPNTNEFFRRWCFTLIAADRAGNQALARQAVEQLVAPPEGDPPAIGNDQRWKCLASHGFVDEALAIVSQYDPDDAASLALDAARPHDAFEALDYPLERLDVDLDQWIEEALAAHDAPETTRLSPEVRELLMLVQVLISVGRHDAAWEIANRLSESEVTVGSLKLREFVLSTLTITRRKDWLLDLTVLENEKTLSPTSLHTVSKTLPDADAMTMEVVVGGLSTMMGSATMQQRFQAAYQLLQGEVPAGFDRETDFRRLYEYVTRARSTRQRVRSSNRPNFLANMNIVQMFALHGESELASATLRKLIESGDSSALFLLAEQELDSGRASGAMQRFEEVYESVVRQGRDSNRFPTAEDSAMAVKALIGRWTVAQRLGDEQLTEQLEREIRLSLCTPSIQTRFEVAQYLGDRGVPLMAMEAYETMLPMTVLGESEDASLYDVARNYSTLAYKQNPDEAARWFDLAINGALDTINFRPGAYIALPLYVHRWSLEGAIERRDEQEAQWHVDRILQLDPLDVDFAERLLPAMREASMKAMADDALHRIMDNGMQYASQFPFDALTANNIAWVAAMNQLRLDDALKLSEAAVTVEPESAIYRDTLAEVLFLLGRKQEALQIEESCLLDDPDQWHLHEQIQKYREAL